MPSVFIHEENDDAFERDLQRQLDAFAEGQRIGRLGLGAGLCPQDYTDEERQLSAHLYQVLVCADCVGWYEHFAELEADPR